MFKRGDFIKEGHSIGLVFTSGPRTFDVIWMGGSTSRYRHGVRAIELAGGDELTTHRREHLTKQAEAARDERRRGARIRRGQIWPSHKPGEE